MSSSEHTRIFSRDISGFADRTAGLIAVVRDGLPDALQQVRTWHSMWRDAPDTTS